MSIVCKKCGTEDFFFEEKKGPHMTAMCGNCGSYIKHLPQNYKPFIIPFGKYKGRTLHTMTDKEELNYLRWLCDQDFCKNNLKDKINHHLIVFK